MTNGQAKKFIRAAAGAFSQVENFLTRDVVDTPQLIGMWARALEPVQDSDAWDVLNKMISGELATPDWGWGEFPALIRGYTKRPVDRTHRVERYAPRPKLEGPTLWERVLELERKR
jgi:hypothetical protein